ncbi:lipoyl synthase [Candidatus Woesearchaeota archaeon]|nr:lipoyl synthase [Candidatus Woesearchaeota archaeon]RLE42985.1 MAG: lipoyl synthase [Candidatus Woesearchaeota archaeon]
MNSVPEWIRIREFDRLAYRQVLALLQSHRVNTVCIEANCPNRYECFSEGTATFMILGNICTRACRYCNVAHGKPAPVDPGECERIAQVVEGLKLGYVVITCVSRDDLEDGGARHFVATVEAIRRRNPECRVELLISDFNGNTEALRRVVALKPDVINHNIEVTKLLFKTLRPKASYELSLSILKQIKEWNSGIVTKSGLMLGLGETWDEVLVTLKHLRGVGVDILTLGQYLQPSPNHAPVIKYYTPQEFELLKELALGMGFESVIAGPMVRSSYHAKMALKK